jgi:hypothetical protein
VHYIKNIEIYNKTDNFPWKLRQGNKEKASPRLNLRRVFNFGLMVRGLSLRPNLTEGPAATWDFRRSTKEEEEETKSKNTNNKKYSGIKRALYFSLCRHK